MNEMMTALGMMSGTSLDGIDAALVRTDGKNIIDIKDCISVGYNDNLRNNIRQYLGQDAASEEVIKELTEAHAEAVKTLLGQASLGAEEVDLIGFHGQTILHKPQEGFTLQIGDGALLAKLTGIDIVCDFRGADVEAGGQGAPLVPLFHAALFHTHSKPLAVLNIGGVANVTYLSESEEDILAFDTGPGNALLNDWVQLHTGEPYDKDGELAASGEADEAIQEALLADGYFTAQPPKSLDRDQFKEKAFALLTDLSPADGASTLAEFTLRSIVKAQAFFPDKPREWAVCGGGAHNRYFIKRLEELLQVPVKPIDDYGFNGDMIEAQAFGYLAVRSRKGLPLTLPGTTGVPLPVHGGVFCPA